MSIISLSFVIIIRPENDEEIKVMPGSTCIVSLETMGAGCLHRNMYFFFNEAKPVAMQLIIRCSFPLFGVTAYIPSAGFIRPERNH